MERAIRFLYIHPVSLPGVEANLIQAGETILALCERGHEVEWVVPKMRGSTADCLGPLGLTSHPLLQLRADPAIRLKNYSRTQSLAVRAKLLSQLRRTARGAQTAIYFRTLKDSRLARFLLIAGRLLRIPVIYEAHKLYAEKRADQGFHDGTIRRAARLEKRVFGGAHGVVCSHPRLLDEIRRRHRPERPTILATNGVREADASSRPPEFDAIYAGSLFDWKGVDICLDAIAQIAGARLAVVGGNPEARLDALKARAAELGIADRVTFFGQVERDRALDLVSRSRVSLVPLDPAFSEGDRYTCPLKMLEAMIRGIPVIAADTDAIRAFVDDGQTALLYPRGDAPAMAHAIQTLRVDPEKARKLASAARATALQHSFQARAERIERFAASLLTTPSSMRRARSQSQMTSNRG